MRAQTFRLSLPSRQVPYVFGRDQASLLPAFLKRLNLQSKSVAVISNSTLFTLHGQRVLSTLREVGREPFQIEVPEGEAFKNLQEVRKIYNALGEARAARSTIVIALGGGVITDMVGFAASTFMRGLPLILIPTTLLAQADAAIGGKTGVNLPEGKNLVGSFYSPELVLIDPEFLKTLSAREFRNGLAEIVKMTILSGEGAFKALERLRDPSGHGIDYFLLLAVKEKLRIVENDPYEAGERMLLNLGHTFAHALEAATSYHAYTHGEAVSIGLVAACRLAHKVLRFPEKDGARVEKLLHRLELPVRYGGVSPEAVLEKMASDKKRGDRLRFVLPREIGDVRIEETVQEKHVLEVLKSLKED